MLDFTDFELDTLKEIYRLHKRLEELGLPSVDDDYFYELNQEIEKKEEQKFEEFDYDCPKCYAGVHFHDTFEDEAGLCSVWHCNKCGYEVLTRSVEIVTN